MANALDTKLTQALVLTKELKDLEQAVIMKQGLINDLMQDIMTSELKFKRDENFNLAEALYKVREISSKSGLITAP